MSTPSLQSDHHQIQKKALNSETIPLFNLHKNIKHSKSKKQSIINKYSISWLDVIIITFVCTINQLIFKSWFVFTPFIDLEYHITFKYLCEGLLVVTTAAFPTVFIIPYLNGYKCNYLCLFLNIFGMSCSVINSILSGSVFNIYIVCFTRTLLSQLFWTLGNSIVFHFMQEIEGEKKWRKNTATTIFMGSWTFSTVLFLIMGPLIDRYGFKETLLMFACLNLSATILLFYRMPAISLDDFIEMEHTLQNGNSANVDSGSNNKLLSDIGILFADMVLIVILLNTLACVTNWGMYYGSFGFWLKTLFDLDAAKLSIYVTICEACAEIISLCAIPILSIYISNVKLCIIGGVCETLSVIMLNTILWNNGQILNTYILTLDIEWLKIGIILLVIFFFYLGHEFLYIVLMVNIDVPKKTHNTAVALYGVFDFMGGFIGQIVVTYVFSKDGMVAMAPIMLIVEFVSVSCLIAMNTLIYRRKKNEAMKVLSGKNNCNEKYAKKGIGDKEEQLSVDDRNVLIANDLLPHGSCYS